MPWSVLWIVTLAAFALSAVAAWRNFRAYGNALAAASLLVILLELSMLCEDRVWLAVFDLGAFVLVGRMFKHRQQAWSFLLAVTFLAQLSAHAGYHSGPKDNPNAYIAFLNATYVLQVVLVGFPGGRHVARSLVGALRPRWARAVHFLDHGR